MHSQTRTRCYAKSTFSEAIRGCIPLKQRRRKVSGFPISWLPKQKDEGLGEECLLVSDLECKWIINDSGAKLIKDTK